MSIDVFDPAFKLPREMYIVGTGWNLRKCIHRIPEKANIIFLNKAIEVPLLDGGKGWWMCMDGKLANHGWFQAWARMLINRDSDHGISPIFEKAILARLYPSVVWTFEQGPNLKEDYKSHEIHIPPWQMMKGYLRNGATIAGMALQLCWWKGVKVVHLAGCDFEGRKYFDGSEKDDDQDEGIWPHLGNMNMLIDLFAGGSRALMTIDSLSETALDVEAV